MCESEFFSVLFEEGEGICAGSRYANKVLNLFPSVYHEYFCINPLDDLYDHGHDMSPKYSQGSPRRADINVSVYRSFMFEIDSLGLEDQLKIFKGCGIPFASVVYSGGKSYHAILSLSEPLSAVPHTYEGIVEYKTVWKRIAAKIDQYAEALGFESETGFVDSSCQNPSRLSRFPNAVRSGGNKQELLSLGYRMSAEDFEALLSSCPEVAKTSSTKNYQVVSDIDNVREFWFQCPKGLKNKLKYVDWAGSSNMYPEIYRVTLWAIESTDVPRDILLEALWDRTFPKLIDAGYPSDRLEIPVDHAYDFKRRG